MTIFWIALWVAVSVFIIGIFVWTTRALMDQKAVWKKFAGARRLTYVPGRFLQAATVRGEIAGFNLWLTSEERLSPDLRGRKFVTLVQFDLPYRMVAPTAVGTGDFRTFVGAMQANAELSLTYPGWEAGQVVAKTDDIERTTPYFNEARLRALDMLVKQKGLSMLFLFDERNCYLRLETVDPMLKPGQLDKLIDGIVPIVKALAPS